MTDQQIKDLAMSIRKTRKEMTRNEYGEAIKIIKQTLKQFPENPFLLFLGGHLYGHINDLTTAAKMYENCKSIILRIKPEERTANMLEILAESYFSLGKYDKASNCCDSFLRRAENEPDMYKPKCILRLKNRIEFIQNINV